MRRADRPGNDERLLCPGRPVESLHAAIDGHPGRSARELHPVAALVEQLGAGCLDVLHRHDERRRGRARGRGGGGRSSRGGGSREQRRAAGFVGATDVDAEPDPQPAISIAVIAMPTTVRTAVSPARTSVRIARARADMSSSAWPPAIRPVSSCAASALTGSTAPTRAARSRAIARSLRWSATLKPSG